ncbi:hypothetical protein GGF46_005097 [Coemansia sp. RSA 552]|nr:hypothetical protein GGF46_005097 [Coemansia sp. RSA 552]
MDTPDWANERYGHNPTSNDEVTPAQQGPEGGGHLGGMAGQWASGTPASRVAAAAMGRRLELGTSHGFGAADEPQGSAFATPVVRGQTQRWDTPEGFGWVEEETPADGRGVPAAGESRQEVDGEFILSLGEEAQLEKLTRKAQREIREAWRPMAMDALRRQVASLDEDEWMYN